MGVPFVPMDSEMQGVCSYCNILMEYGVDCWPKETNLTMELGGFLR